MNCLDKLAEWIIYIGLPIVAMYHDVRENIFVNFSADDATGLEKIGNVCLVPIQYLLDGKRAVKTKDGTFSYTFKDGFNYDHFLALKLCGSALTFQVSTILGSLIKGAAYFFPETRKRHENLHIAYTSSYIISNNEYYRSIGIEFDSFDDLGDFQSAIYKRRKEDKDQLFEQKEALKAIASILQEHRIPFWLDCGSLLGAYRYRGVIPWDFDVDIAILEPDHDNVRRALQELDQTRFICQDWSGRGNPNTTFRVYVREAHDHLDIYHFRVDEENKAVSSILSSEKSRYMPESWKIRERRFSKITAFNDIFPLKKVCFDGIEAYMPNRTKEYLQARYGQDLRPAKIYNKESGKYENDLGHPYWKRTYVH